MAVASTAEITQNPERAAFDRLRSAAAHHPLFLHGDAGVVLGRLPAESIDCCMTSPPYWGQRSYAGGGMGLESRYEDYVRRLVSIFDQVKRVLKRTGS
ncbi:MAG TPA: DNA methyltransferase, partial [Pirellulales bacterium]